MKRGTLEILRCVRCQAGRLEPEGEIAAAKMTFGPVRCHSCGARYPVGEGLIDFVGERRTPKGLQGKLEAAWFARSYEKYVRPSLELLLTRGGFDRDSEYLVYARCSGARRARARPRLRHRPLRAAARERAARPADHRLDVSKPMIEEAIAQAREASRTSTSSAPRRPRCRFKTPRSGPCCRSARFT